MSSHLPEFKIHIFLKKHIFKGQNNVKIWGPKQDRTQSLNRDSSEIALLVRSYVIYASPLASLVLVSQLKNRDNSIHLFGSRGSLEGSKRVRSAFGKHNTPEELWLMNALFPLGDLPLVPSHPGCSLAAFSPCVAEDPLPLPAWQCLAGRVLSR